MKSLVVIINGKPRSGKDKFVELCSKYTTVKNVSSIDLVREAFRIMNYIKKDDELAKNEVTRRAMSMMKTMSVELSEAPFRYCRDEIIRFVEKHTGIIFVHVREAKEIDKLVEFINSYKENHPDVPFDSLKLCIESENSEDVDNPSDLDVENTKYDLVIKNPGTEAPFEEIAQAFVEEQMSSF